MLSFTLVEAVLVLLTLSTTTCHVIGLKESVES